MNKAASITLTALMSILVSILVLLPIGKGVVSFFAESHESKASEIVEFLNLIESTKINDFSTRSLRLDKEDLFLFFSKGIGPITLKYSKQDGPQDFIFERPTECIGVSCICYCQSGPFWSSIKTSPFLESRTLFAGIPYSCPVTNCRITPNSIVFSNSRGENLYSDIVLNKLANNKRVIKNVKPKNENGRVYIPITLDIVTILQRQNVLKTSFSKDVGNFFLDDSIFNLIEDNLFKIPIFLYKSPKNSLDYYKKYFKMELPFFENGESSFSPRYDSVKQESFLTDMILKDYFWQGGYVLGGYGVAISRSDRQNHKLQLPPVILTFERKENDIIGICIHKTCLSDEGYKKALKEKQEMEAKEKLQNLIESLESEFLAASSCLDTNLDGSFYCLDSVNSLLFELFLLEESSSLDPIFKSTYTILKPIPNLLVPSQIISIQDDTLMEEDSKQPKLYGSFSLPYMLSCSVDDEIKNADFSLSEGSYAEDGDSVSTGDLGYLQFKYNSKGHSCRLRALPFGSS